MSESDEREGGPPPADDRSLQTVRRAWESLSRDLLGVPEYSAVELGELSGASPELLVRLWQSLGFAPVPTDERMFSTADVDTVRALVNLPRGAGDEEFLVHLTRMAGQTQARLAEAMAELVAERDEQGQTGADLIARDAPFIKSLEPLLSYVWRRHLLAALGRRLVSADGTGGRVLVVGFADLVAFTALARQLKDARLVAVLERFEALVYAHVPGNRGRIVKFLGDEVLFVADTAVDAAEISLGLIESIAADPELTEIRVGLALGPVIALDGDVFGHTVNLASRLVDEARPSTVLASEELGAALSAAPGIVAQRLRGRLNLKGIGRVSACAVRRPTAADQKKAKKEAEKATRAAQKEEAKRRRSGKNEAAPPKDAG